MIVKRIKEQQLSNLLVKSLVCPMLGILLCLQLSVGASSASETVKMVSDPAISPDGATIAFTWRDDIWTAPIEGGKVQRLTTDAGRDSQPHFSPDGKRIAFISDRTGSDQIYTIDVSGGTPKQLTYHSEGYSLHDWFPDGKHLLASGSRDHYWRGTERLLKVPTEKRAAEIVLADATATDASLDRKGKNILFVREGERWWRKGYTGERAAQIWQLNLEDGEITELLHEGVDCRWPIWHRSGKYFYFTKGDLNGFGLWRYQFAENEDEEPKQRQLAKFEDDSIVFPSIARNGHTVLFRHLFDLYRFDPRNDDVPVKIELIYEGDPTANDDELRREFTQATEAVFTRDGLESVFVAGGDIWAMDTELREPIQLTQTGAHESSVIFGPEEKSLLTVAKVDGQVDIYRLERKVKDGYWWQASDISWTQITNDPSIESDLRLSPDGKHLFYVRGLGELVRVSLTDTTQSTTITSSFSSPNFDVSPCGCWVAYAESDDDFNSEVWIAKADGSLPPVNISQHPHDDFNPRFSPDGKLLAFTGQRTENEIDIHYVWLQANESERTSRDRKLAEALKKMEEKRKSETDKGKTKSDSKEDGAADGKDDGNADAKSSSPEVEQDEKSETAEENCENGKATVIDFERIEDRVRTIPILNSAETNLFWSPDGKKLAFNASVDGERATYTVTFPDELQPTKLTSETIGQPQWSKEANAILGHVSGVPASIDGAGKVKKFPFTARQIISRSDRFRDGFEEAWAVMRDRWYDGRHANRNWAEVRRKFIDMAGAAGDESTFGQIVELMLGELNGSHNGFSPSRTSTSSITEGWTDSTAHLGVRFDRQHQGPGLLVRDVLPGGPADRVESRLLAGDVIISIDGKEVDPGMDLTEVLNGRLDRDISLLVNRTDGDATVEVRVSIRPISFAAARNLLYDQWLIRNREMVDKASAGRLGYLHIRAMNMTSFSDFQRELYRVGYGREGLVIDVRDNGGGSTTDLLLTALTQPRHAITVPRGGGAGYPQSRMVYAVWQKPIVVLCNQNSYSNAEIFSHAIKNLGRGQLVGVETAGGVISTGSVRITDVGTMRMPFRGWFSVADGQDMEMNGAKPDHVLWPAPGEIPAGIDKQLEKAIEVLLTELEEKPKQDPKLIYASER